MAKIISLILKTIIIVSAVLGTILSAVSRSYYMSGKTIFMYFTIQSNIAIAIICGIGAYLLLTKKKISNTWYVIKFIGTISITLTGGVFSFVLAPTLGAAAWVIQNTLTHIVVPLASIADFFIIGILLGENSYISKKKIGLVLLPPLAYVFYAAIGYVQNWEFAFDANYPYFFLNWGSPAGAFGFSDELPYVGCMWWILGLLVLLLLVAWLYLTVLEVFKKQFSNISKMPSEV